MDKQITDILSNYLPIVALILAVLSLFLFSKLSGKINEALKSIAFINETRSSSPEPQPKLKFDEQRVTVLEASLKQLTEQIHEIKQAAIPAPDLQEPEPVAAAAAEPAPQEDKDLVYFSKFPDLDNGFTDSYLKEKQNGEQIYELILTPDQGRGVFYVSEASDAQKYALSDVNYYLPKACNFINQPGKNVSIKTIEAGTLIRSGESWIIEEKAQIEFV